MDTFSGHINLKTPPQPHSSTGDTSPPHVLTSVNQLRSFSTALSAFITGFDELHTHINFINSSIDSILPRHLIETANQSSLTTTSLLEFNYDQTIKGLLEVTASEQNPKETATLQKQHKQTDSLKDYEETVLEGSCDDQTTTVVTEDIVSEQNPNGMATGCERTKILQDYEETVALKEAEVVDVLKNCEETVPESLCDRAATVVVPEAVVSEQNPNGMATDCEGRYETVRTCENDEYLQDYEEPDALKKDEGIYSCEGIDVLQKYEETDATDCEGRYETVQATGNDEFLEDKDNEEPDALNKLEFVNVWKSYEEVYTCEGIDGLHEHQAVETKRTIENDEYLQDYKEIDALSKPEEIYSCEGIDALHKHEETVALKKHEITVPDCDQTINDVSEVVVSEQNPSRMVSDCEGRYETARATENDEYLEDYGGGDALNKLEVVDVRNNCEGIDGLRKHEETDALKKLEETVPEVSCDQAVTDENMRIHEETDSLKKHIETVPESFCERTTTVVVSEQNPNGMATDSKFLQDYGECDALKKLEVVDVSRNHEEVYTCEGIDALQNHDALKKPEEAVAESLCDQTVTDVPEAVVSEQNANRMDTDCEGRYETVRMTENAEFLQDYEESDALNKLEFVDGLENSEEIYTCEGIDELQKHVETDALKKDEESVPESFCDRTTTDVTDAVVSEQNDNGMAANGEQSHEHVRIPENLGEIDVSKQPEQTDILNKHEQTDICKNLEGTVVLKESEGLDTLMIPEEIDEPEGTVTETSCDQTITAVSEAIVSEQNPNGMDANSEQSHENVTTPDGLEEIDILKKPEELDTSMIPEEIDTSKKPEETVPGTSCDQTTPAVPDATVSKQIHNRMATNREKSHGNVSKKRAVIDTTPEQTDILKKPKQTDIDTSKNQDVTVVLKKHVETDTSKNRKEIDTLKKHEKTGTYKKAKETKASKKSVISTLEYLCQSMNSKEMRRHVAAHFSEMINLRKEMAKALKLAEDPAKLVLDSIGRFYVQGRRTFRKGLSSDQDKQNQGRMAAVLILECFVMISSDGIEIAKRDQENAAQAAADWIKRMTREGRLRHADEVDARGLLLLISGFGIEDRVFKIHDILDLIRASNVKGISAALRRSVFLVPKIPDVIDLMVKKNLEIEAADIAYTFGLEDKCHPRSILVSFLRSNIRNIPKGSQKLEEMKQQLLDLKAVKQCLESHNIDPSTHLPDFKINKEIQNLEKELNDAKRMKKRKSLERPIHQEAKRACFGHENMPRHQNPADHHGMDRRCYQSTQLSTCYFDSDQDLISRYISNYSPAMRGTVTGPVLNGFPGSYVHVRHSAIVQPYGLREPYVQHYLRHGQAYDSQPYGRGRLSGRAPPEASPPFHLSGGPGPSSGLYGFADVVERETRGFHA